MRLCWHGKWRDSMRVRLIDWTTGRTISDGPWSWVPAEGDGVSVHQAMWRVIKVTGGSRTINAWVERRR